ncbi:MAG: hypothetical protein JWQ35_1525 [Bacteriovoracaceae bacterium]|nr:hypothetical protein [Bacteriovoracaceae bacterium]
MNFNFAKILSFTLTLFVPLFSPSKTSAGICEKVILSLWKKAHSHLPWVKASTKLQYTLRIELVRIGDRKVIDIKEFSALERTVLSNSRTSFHLKDPVLPSSGNIGISITYRLDAEDAWKKTGQAQVRFLIDGKNFYSCGGLNLKNDYLDSMEFRSSELTKLGYFAKVSLKWTPALELSATK